MRWASGRCFALGLGVADVDQDNVFADFDDMSKINKQAVLFRVPAFAVGRNDAHPPIFGVAKHHVANFAKLSAVLRVYYFFSA